MAGEAPDDRPPPEPPPERRPFRSGASWFVPVGTVAGHWAEIANADQAEAERLVPLIDGVLAGEGDTLRLGRELAGLYEEIELLYSISETLSRTLDWKQAAKTIVREVCTVVGARRGTLLEVRAEGGALHHVAGWGVEVDAFGPLAVDDTESIAAQVFRSRQSVAYDPRNPGEIVPHGGDRPYRGDAFLSVPILSPAPDGDRRPLGVINLTDRKGADAFGVNERRLVEAVAQQIGAIMENARLLEGDREQQRLRRELELAHDLQLRLLKPPALPNVDFDARCEPAADVGGDFFHVSRLSGGRLGVMLGDVSSHGYPAALIMALVLSAAGIHADDAASPDETQRRLLESIGDDLQETEMYLPVCYVVVDPARRVLRYANAGHPHAFRVPRQGEPVRLAAGSPPLGLGGAEIPETSEEPWLPGDRLVLFTDGISEAPNPEGQQYTEGRLLDLIRRHANRPAREIVEAAFLAVEAWALPRTDDRTLLVLGA